MSDLTTNMKLSVCVVTYNHEKYLAEALDSILMQEVDFPIEIEIGEDRSTDKTLEICRAYEKEYPEIIRLHVNEKNLGYNWNFYRTMEQCRGEYVAVLDGDDLWTDPQKLKKQIDFLDNHPEYSMCFSKYYVCDEDSKLGQVTGFSGDYDLNDVLAGQCPGTRTVVFRKKYFPAVLPDEFEQISYADHILFALIASQGPICGLDEPKELIFQAGTKLEDGKLVTAGGRVLNVVAHGSSLVEARTKCYRKVSEFYFDDMFFRKDIGSRKN